VNAVVKPTWQRLRTELKQMVDLDGYPLESIQLTDEEAVRWLEEEGREPGSVAYYMLDALADLNVAKFAKANDLLTKMMLGTMTVDEATQWRDLQKDALKAYTSIWARRVVDEELL
jgi:hypothetical protein